jgi:hypothetical protein
MHRSRLPLIIAFVASGLVACYTGPGAAEFNPAITGHGVECKLWLERREIKGELLELRDSGYVMTSSEGLVLVPFSAVRGATFWGIGSFSGGAPGADMGEQIRLSSRFPHGIPSRAFDALLANANQHELKLVRE